jgi:hypothetical protein
MHLQLDVLVLVYALGSDPSQHGEDVIAIEKDEM